MNRQLIKKSTTRYLNTCRVNQVVLSWGKISLLTIIELRYLLQQTRKPRKLSTLSPTFQIFAFRYLLNPVIHLCILNYKCMSKNSTTQDAEMLKITG